MGKRKSRAKPPPKKKLKLDKCFTCPFCNHPGTVKCTMDKKLMTSEAFCYICEESYSTTIHGKRRVKRTTVTDPGTSWPRTGPARPTKTYPASVPVVLSLSEPIDVYSEWIDECERANNFED